MIDWACLLTEISEGRSLDGESCITIEAALYQTSKFEYSESPSG